MCIDIYILPDLIYQNPTKYGSMVYMRSCRNYVINSTSQALALPCTSFEAVTKAYH